MRLALLFALVPLLLPAAARADPGFDAVLAALLDEAGWTVHRKDAKGGVDVYKKDIPGLETPAFMGVKSVDVPSDAIIDALWDFPAHKGLSEDIPLAESEVLASGDGWRDFYQYLDTPGWTLANDRFWFARAQLHRNVGGRAGHHRQTWRRIDETRYPEALARARARDEDAVLTPLNYGLWELVPLEDGRTKLIYRVVSDPGGRLPRSAANLATGTTLPDNILQFEAEGRRRAAR